MARWIAEEGFRVLLVEEHEEIGHPLHCAGLVTPRTLKAADLQSDSLVQNELTGAVIRSLSGEELSIGGDKMHALGKLGQQHRHRITAVLQDEQGLTGALGTV